MIVLTNIRLLWKSELPRKPGFAPPVAPAAPLRARRGGTSYSSNTAFPSRHTHVAPKTKGRIQRHRWWRAPWPRTCTPRGRARRRGPRGGIWPTPEPPPMGAPTVRLTPRGHGRPLQPPERAAVRRKLGLRGLRSRPARTCLVLKPAKRLAIRPNPSACFCHV